MSLADLQALGGLYRQVILEHAQQPHHQGTVPDATHQAHLHNPTCGDDLTVSLVVKNDRLEAVAFMGSGCTISQASASMMTDLVLHHSVEQAQQLAQAFYRLVTDESISQDEIELGDAALLAGVKQFPTRIKCATLAWKTLEAALADQQNKEEDYE